MKRLLFTLAAFGFAFQAQAHGRTPAAQKGSGSSASYSSTPSSSSYSSDRKNVLSPSIGWMGAGGSNYLKDGDKADNMKLSGLFNIGVEYEYMLKDDFSIGGFLRYGTTTDSLGGNVTKTETAFLLGPMAHAYLVNNEHWIAYVGSGFSLVSLTAKQSGNGADQTVSPNMALGIPFSIGVAYKFTDTISGGIENMRVMALGSDINGWVTDDMMLRLRLML